MLEKTMTLDKKMFPYKPVEKVKLYEQVANQIKSAIYHGHLKPGDSLPSERKLAEMFNVGRPTIREALRTLNIMGLIDVNTGHKGTRIREYHDIVLYLEALREQMSWLIKCDRKTLIEIWEVRKYLELGIAQSVALNATEAEIKRLEKILGRMEKASGDIAEYFPVAIEFHQELAKVSHNKIFHLTWETFHDIVVEGYKSNLHDAFPQGAAKLVETNRELLKAIKKGDPDLVSQAMEKHALEGRPFEAAFKSAENNKTKSKSEGEINEE